MAQQQKARDLPGSSRPLSLTLLYQSSCIVDAATPGLTTRVDVGLRGSRDAEVAYIHRSSDICAREGRMGRSPTSTS
jgi:hypothetical protein